MSESLSLPGVELELDVPVAMRDGVLLSTDIYRPPGVDPVPALLLRTPYGKRDVESQSYAHPAWYVSRGFAVISQDVRGRWDSEGEFLPFANEASDGADTIAWIAAQAWCSGAVGTYGFSYPGATQLLAAPESPALKAMAPAMTGSNYCEGWTYRNRTLNLAFVLTWAAGLGMDQATRAGDVEAEAGFAELFAAPQRFFASLPLRDAIPEPLLTYAPYFRDWLEHRDYDDYWRQWSPMEHYDEMRMPALHIAGWYDVFLEPTIDNFAALAGRGAAHQMLVVGPWFHMPWSQRVGELDFGAAGRNLIDETQARFFARWLRDEDNGIDREPPVHLFLLGANRWITESTWPPPVHEQTLFLASDGRGASLNGNGVLADAPPPAGSPPDGYPASPRAPVLSLGGRSASSADLSPMGPMDQRSQEVRNDVLVFTSQTLSGDLTIIGYPQVVLHVASSAPTSDFVARLVDVFPDERAINLSDGIERLAEGADTETGVREITLRLSPIANCFLAGHRIRLEVTSSNFPMHERNPHCDIDSFDVTSPDLRIASQFVYHDALHPSRLILPVTLQGIGD